MRFRGIAALSFAALVGCEPRLVLGGGCTSSSECPADLVCQSGRCRTECTTQRDCPLGARCVIEGGVGSCSLADDARCPAVACASSLVCIASGACVNACETAATCPPGSRCALDSTLRSYCERDDTDAGPLDAGPPPGDAGCLPPTCDPVEDIAVTTTSSCARTRSGAVWCWGEASQLGAGRTFPSCLAGSTCSATPVRVRRDVASITSDVTGSIWLAGAESGYAIVLDGQVFSWGSATRALGTLGGGDLARAVRLEPDGDTFLEGAGGVRVGAAFGMAIGSGSVWAWGDEDRAQRGEGVGTGSDFAELAMPLDDMVDVVLGDAHGCGITSAGIVECWGANGNGQVDATTAGAGANVVASQTIPGLPPGVSELALGRSHTCALASGEVWCWGNRNSIGRLTEPPGCTDGVDRRACPAIRVTRTGPEFLSLGATASSNTTCAIDGDGAVSCWGEDVAPEPMPILGLPPVTAVAIGFLHACAVTTSGEVWCWGNDAYGQLGRGTPTDTDLDPAPVVWP